MKKNTLFLLLAGVALVACRSNNQAPAGYNEMVEVVEYDNCVNCGRPGEVKYSMPRGNDLVLETSRHVIQIDAQPGVKYDYYVWTGDKSYADDPDLIVQEGVAAVLVEE